MCLYFDKKRTPEEDLSMWGRFVKSVIIGVPVVATFSDYIGYVARVEGISMQPALNPDNVTDYVFLSRCSLNYDIKKRDIISCISPKNKDQIIIKRVIATEGELLPSEDSKRRFYKVPEGHCWIEGDHVGYSLDSKTFGPIPLGLVMAKAKAIVWPPERWQLL